VALSSSIRRTRISNPPSSASPAYPLTHNATPIG
jgi:hypothetical protein